MRLNKKIFKGILVGVGIVLILLFGGFLVYTSDYYRASDDVASTISEYTGDIQQEGNYTIIYPPNNEEKEIGLVFYPGAKVEAQAYIPFLIQLAQQGVTSVLVKMPFNLAVFNINAADQAMTLVPDISEWYLSGHSLGGAMASSYTNKNFTKVNGLILLAAYPINEANIPILQIYGSNDLVLNQEEIDVSVPYYEIKGGNHAYFGNYGNQDGDGEASITRLEQQDQTIQQILHFMGLGSYEQTR